MSVTFTNPLWDIVIAVSAVTVGSTLWGMIWRRKPDI
jgi:hypothetical protein